MTDADLGEAREIVEAWAEFTAYPLLNDEKPLLIERIAAALAARGRPLASSRLEGDAARRDDALALRSEALMNTATWDQFETWLREVRTRMEDRWAPVALICAQATTNDDGSVDLKLWNDAAMVWPAAFPVSERGPLLERLAKPYRDGTVLR